MHLPKPQISRLQRIRPPPLPLNNAIPIQSISANSGHQSTSLFSPLPPFPTVHAAADSPISAYMKYLRESTPSSMGLASQSVIPSSPLGFGLVSSPRSPYPLISPKSPTAASLEFFQ
ncbi:hypothetical protein IFM89_037990 [Coptis chinensis]|uniref:Uncharacterized protein n=1 Tax=Coptis chinensis TaxID=261450 RepID=A0A835M635_9MAGN|nr:hypothetical protein IFM89_037990 [Coptis chinensis]